MQNTANCHSRCRWRARPSDRQHDAPRQRRDRVASPRASQRCAYTLPSAREQQEPGQPRVDRQQRMPDQQGQPRQHGDLDQQERQAEREEIRRRAPARGSDARSAPASRRGNARNGSSTSSQRQRHRLHQRRDQQQIARIQQHRAALLAQPPQFRQAAPAEEVAEVRAVVAGRRDRRTCRRARNRARCGDSSACAPSNTVGALQHVEAVGPRRCACRGRAPDRSRVRRRTSRSARELAARRTAAARSASVLRIPVAEQPPAAAPARPRPPRAGPRSRWRTA